MKNKVFSRLTSLLLVFIMIFTMLPLQVFAVGEGGGSDAKINSSNKYVKDNGYDANATGVGGIFNAFALRFSLYFFEGAESYEDLETKNYTHGNIKKCAVGKHPKSEKHGNTAQFSEVERSGTQENCGGIGSGCRLRLRPLPVLHRRQSQRVARIDPNAVVVDKNIAENDRFDLFSR